MARVSRKDLRRLANNSAAALADMQHRGQSLAVCFDALVTVLDDWLMLRGSDGVPVLLSDKLKEELGRRANALPKRDEG